MALGWLKLLQSVPWSEVIRNAPKVASAAKKLWNAVAKKSSAAEVPDPGVHTSTSSESQSVPDMQARVIELETKVSDLSSQMLASSELIKALADQNEQLIRRIETNRAHMIRLTIVIIITVIIALFSVFLAFFRQNA